MGKFKKILFILTNKEKKHSLFLLVMVLIMAFLEMVGVASIMPFMSVLTNPDVVETNNLLNRSKFFTPKSLFDEVNKFLIKDNKNKEFLVPFEILTLTAWKDNL